MATQQQAPGARESRSIRMNEHEWSLAEALSALSGGTVSAGAGLRTALQSAVDQAYRQGRGERLEAMADRIRAQRAAGGQ